MRFRKWLLWCLSLSLIFLLTGLSWAQDEEDEEEPAGERPVLKVGVLPADFRLDGLVGPLAEGTDSYAIEDLITIEPEEEVNHKVRPLCKFLPTKRILWW